MRYLLSPKMTTTETGTELVIDFRGVFYFIFGSIVTLRVDRRSGTGNKRLLQSNIIPSATLTSKRKLPMENGEPKMELLDRCAESHRRKPDKKGNTWINRPIRGTYLRSGIRAQQ